MDDIPELVTDLKETEGKQYSRPSAHDNYVAKEPELPVDTDKRIPITIITGYLGSGKSTLLQNIGKNSTKKLAIILNEFGDSSAIEKLVTIQDSNDAVQEWLDLGNGCLCCTVKDNGVLAIEQLIARSKGAIDYILLETTGIADPAPIAKMFWLDEALASNVYIDSVITVLDSENILTCLDDVGGHWHRQNNHLKSVQSVNPDDITEEELQVEKAQLEEGITTAHLQIALADVLLVNKMDLINEEKLAAICSRVRTINSSAPIYPTLFGDIDLDKILDRHAFEANLDKLTTSLSYATDASFHDDRISTITLLFPFFIADSFGDVDMFLRYILWENKANGKDIEVHRVKGILVKDGETRDVRVIQGVRDTYDVIKGGTLADGITENKLVLIGKGLDKQDLEIELKKYIK